MANKIKYGLKNVHYAVITESNGIVSYGTPKPIPGAVNLSLSPAGEKVEFYADDLLYFGANTNQGYEGTLEIALIPDSFRADVMGEEIDENGAYIENSSIIPKNFALLFEFAGDINAVRHALYNVNAARPDVKGSTKTKNIEPQTETVNITASPAIDTYDVKASLPYSTDPAYTNFFTAVYLKNAVTNTASNPTAFSKASPVDVLVDVTSSSGTNSVKSVYMDGVPVGFAYLSISGVDVTLDKTYVGTLTNGDHTILVEFTQGNAVSVTLTVGA